MHQLFLFVVAEYSTPTAPLNQVVIWDYILLKPDPSNPDTPLDAYRIDLDDENWKYFLKDKALLGKDITLKFYWDEMPITSFMKMGVSDTVYTFKMPNSYTK